MTSYAIDKDLRLLRHFNLPLGRSVLPAALNQCVAVYQHIIDHAEAWHIDTSRMAIGGDSAGASLACDTYLRLRQEKAVMPKTLLLVYPVVDNLQQTESVKRLAVAYPDY